MRLEFEQDELRRLAREPGSVAALWGPAVTAAYRRRVQALHVARDEIDLRALVSLRLRALAGADSGSCSLDLSGQYRLVVRFRPEGPERVARILRVAEFSLGSDHYE